MEQHVQNRQRVQFLSHPKPWGDMMGYMMGMRDMMGDMMEI
jgi:hypothetical protein